MQGQLVISAVSVIGVDLSVTFHCRLWMISCTNLKVCFPLRLGLNRAAAAYADICELSEVSHVRVYLCGRSAFCSCSWKVTEVAADRLTVV